MHGYIFILAALLLLNLPTPQIYAAQRYAPPRSVNYNPDFNMDAADDYMDTDDIYNPESYQHVIFSGSYNNTLEDFLYNQTTNGIDIRQLTPDSLQSYAEESSKENTALHFACLLNNLNFVKNTFNDSIMDAQNNDGDTPLHCACQKKNLDIVRFLIVANVDQFLRNNAGIQAYSLDICLSCLQSDHPLHKASADGHNECLTELLAWSKQDIDAPFTYPTPKAYIDRIFFDCRANLTPLHLAARNLHPNCVETLCKHGANPCSKNAFDMTPLHEALDDLAFSRKIFIEKIFHVLFANHKNKDQEDIVLALLNAAKSRGDDNFVNALDKYGWTPLAYAHFNQYTKSAHILATHDGTDSRWINYNRRSIIMIAIATLALLKTTEFEKYGTHYVIFSTKLMGESGLGAMCVWGFSWGKKAAIASLKA